VRLILIFSLLISGCQWFRSNTVATVGDYQITQQDLNYRKKVIKIYNPRETRDLSYLQLKEAFLLASILKNNGVEVSDTTLKKEASRINEKSNNQEVLAKIRAVFGKDIESYLKVYVLPIYVKREIYYNLFLKSESIHDETLKKAKLIIASAESSRENLQALATQNELRFLEFYISPRYGMVPFSEIENFVKKQYDESFKGSNIGKLWVDEVVSSTKPGEIYKNIVNFGETWLVVKYVKQFKKTDFYHIQGIEIKKIAYSEWLANEKLKIKISENSK
jgi:hypothetical protein